MVLLVNEILNWSYSGYRDKVVRVHRIVGNDLDSCFQRVYGLERSSRYDYQRRYEIRDSKQQSQYQDWKAGNLTIDLYYGSATVD